MPTVDEWMEDGHGHLATGDLAAAAEAYRQATEVDPDSFDAWHARAMALMKLGRFEEALAAGQQTIRLRPNDQMAYTTLSLIHVRMGRIKEAEEMGAKARILSWGGKVKKTEG